MLRWKITFVLVLLSLFCKAQEGNQLVISGQVLTLTGTPIQTVNIIDTKNTTGTTTDQDGFFYLSLKKQPTTLKISHIGYSTIEKKITASDLNQTKNDTLFLRFTMKNSSSEIKAVTVNSNSIQQVYPKKGTYLLDYEFIDNNLLLLFIENKESKLRLVDSNNNTLYSLAIRKNPNQLFRDCFDQLHLQYKDSSYQINFQNQSFQLGQGHDQDKFNTIASPCITSIDDVIFLRDYGPDNKVLLYSTLQQGTKLKQGIHQIVNDLSLLANQDYRVEEIGRYKALVGDAHMMGDNNSVIQSTLRKIERNEYYLEQILKKPDYHPLFKINNSIFIFNHLVDSIFIYNSVGAYQNKVSIDYHHQNDWAEEIFVEFEGQNVYAKFKKSGSIYLKQIDTNSGKTLKTTKIEKHLFPENLKVKNGFVYYLFTDPFKTSAPKKLYRQALN